jgi:O-antigen/teichoic acid export membrane protein
VAALPSRFRQIATSQFRLNIVSGFAANIVSALITFLGYRIYLNYLGYERYGLWLILSTVLLMVQLGNFGISPAVLKFVAEDFANEDVAGVYRYITSALTALAVGGTVIVTCIWLLRSSITTIFGLSGQGYQFVYGMLPYIAVLSVYVIMVDTLNAALAGLGRYDMVNYTQTASQAISLCVTVFGLQMGWDLWSFVAGSASAYFFLNVCSVLLIRRFTKAARLRDCTVDRTRLIRVLQYGGWVFSGSVIAVLVNPINRVLVSRFIGVAALPIYDIANTGTMKIRNFLEVGFRPLTPALSKLQASGCNAVFERLVSAERTGSRFVLYWGTALHVAVFAIAGWGLQVWLGPRFSATLPSAFRIFLVGSYISLWSVQAYYTLLGLGRSKHVLISFVIQLVLDVGVIYSIAVLRHGTKLSLNDVAVGAAAGLTGITIYLRWQSRRVRIEYREQCEAAAK